MHEKLANLLSDKSVRLAEVEAKTGVTTATMRNIIKDPKKERARVIVIALESYFKSKGKK